MNDVDEFQRVIILNTKALKKSIICPDCNGIGETDEKAYGFSNGDYYVCPKCRGIGRIEVPMTNADYIDSMDIEEKAKFLFKVMHNIRKALNAEEIINWLQQKYEGSL